MRKPNSFICALLALMVFWPSLADSASSQLVYSGPDGLVYNTYANRGQTNAVHTIPDFSSAGYQGGGVPIPFVPAAVTLSDDGPTDDTARIQNAINTVSALPVDSDGFRGAVLLEAGEYTVSRTLRVSKSGVVIRGAGSQEEGGTRITYTSTNKSNLFEVAGGSGPSEVGGTRVGIASAYVPVGANSFELSNASGFAPGDTIVVQNMTNQKWLDDLSDMSQWGWSVSGYRHQFRRVITAIDGNRITIDVPIVQTIEDPYGGGDVYRYSANLLENIGFEALRLESTFIGPGDEQHGWIAIRMDRVQNSWVRQVTGRYFGFGLVTIDSNSQKVTVEDCAMLDHQSMISGGRRYSFNIDDSQQLLIQRCLTRDGRHDYVSGSRTHGPNAFVDCRADNTNADIGPHHRYATGQLYDNIKGGSMNGGKNSRSGGSGHGWTGAQILYWNSLASSLRVDAPNGAMNWCIGSTGTKVADSGGEPFGFWDSHNVPVTPRSLYYSQLADRLGVNAMNSVVLPQQKEGAIWDELHEWGGDGLFLDELIVLADEETIPAPGQAVEVRGIVRDLSMLDRGVSCLWSKVYGPGSATFVDDAALETEVSFSEDGIYLIRLSVDDGISSIDGTVVIRVGDGGTDTTAPATPTNLTATADSLSISLDWADNSESDLAGYDVFRSTGPGEDGEPLVYGLLASEYVDLSIEKGVAYSYTVRAVDTNSNASARSSEASATVNALPSVEFVEPLEGASFNDGDSVYVQVIASDKGGSVSKVELFIDGRLVREEFFAPYEWGAGNQNDPLLENLTLGTYTLEAVATDDQGASVSADITISVEPNTAPAQPAGLIATPDFEWVTLNWDANTELDLAGYRIYRSTTPGSYGAAVAEVAGNSFDDTGLVGGTTYFYRIAAVDNDGLESVFSSEVTAIPKLPPPGTVLFGFNNDGLGGFTHSDGGSTQIWSTQVGSVQYRNENTGMRNASLLKAYPLDRSDGQSYTIEGVISLTDGYPEDNARVGLYLFGDSSVIPNDDEAGALYFQRNFEGSMFTVNEGIQRNFIAESYHGRAKDITWFTDEEIRISVDFTFNGANIDIEATLTDGRGTVTTVNTSVLAANFTGDYFGFATRSRTRDFGVEGSIKSAPFTMDYRSFRVTSPDTPPSAPTGLTATAGDRFVSLDWEDNNEDDLFTYTIYRSETSGEYDGSLSLSLPSSDYIDHLVDNSNIYYYVVTSVDSGGNESEPSSEVSVIPAASDNQAPSFSSNLIVAEDAEISTFYNASITGDASDPESDPMTFSLLSGPTWLNVAPDGSLSGIPGEGDLGLNSFTVNVFAAGGSDMATLEITVVPIVESNFAGLWFGTVSGDINTSAANPRTEILVDVSSKTEDSIANETTEIFTGQIYDADGRISFTEDIDDRTRIYIDGNLVLFSNVWNNRVSTGNLDLAPGWHDIEIRISNGGGPGGPHSSPGIGFDPNGGTDWQLLTDPGNASLLRCEDPPVADAGPDQNVTDLDANGRESVVLDASGSSDANGTIVNYTWRKDSTLVAVGVGPTLSLSVGEHLITLTVVDDEGSTVRDTVTITVAPSPNIDSDGDGMSDVDEQLAGSDANDPDSRFGIEVLSPNPDHFVFQIPTAPGSHYRVLYSGTLSPSGWSPLPGYENVVGDGNRLRIEDSFTGSRFYKIQVRAEAW